MDVHSPEFRTAMQRRIHLAGVEQAFRSKAHLTRCCCSSSSVNISPIRSFLHPDAVLAGQHAADPHAGAQNVGAECLDLLQIAGVWRRRGSAGADCRRRHERRCSSAARIAP